MNERRILIIDDDPAIREDYKKILQPDEETSFSEIEKLERALFLLEHSKVDDSPKYQLSFASQGKEGYEQVIKAIEEKDPFSVAFIDIRMPPGWDGMETASRIKKHDHDLEIVIVTAYSDRDRMSIVDAIEDPSKLLYLKKPFDPDEIRQLAHSLSEKWRLQRKEREYRGHLEKMIELFSSLQLDVETEQELLTEIFSIVMQFFQSNAGLLRFRQYNGKETFVVNPITLDKDDIPASSVLPESVSILEEKFLSIPLILANGEGEIIVEISEEKMDPSNAILLGRIVIQNMTNIFNSFHFQREVIEKNSLAAVGNAVGRIIHDINNPLSAILGFAALIEKSRSTNEKDLRRVRSIISASENIRWLINSLHDLTTKDIHFHKEQVDVKRILTEVSEDFLGSFEKAGIGFSMLLPKEPVVIETDKLRLKQVLTILMDNSYDSTERGRGRKEIEIGLKIDGSYLLIWVEDSGCGISEEIRDKIWNPFSSFGRKNRIGLGLALAKKYIELSRGSISVESEINKGSIFTLRLPIA